MKGSNGFSGFRWRFQDGLRDFGDRGISGTDPDISGTDTKIGGWRGLPRSGNHGPSRAAAWLLRFAPQTMAPNAVNYAAMLSALMP